MGPVTAPQNFLQILDDAVNYNLEKAAQKKGIPVQTLFMIFQESGWQKDANNLISLDAINRKYDRVEIRENKVDAEYKKEYLVYVS